MTRRRRTNATRIPRFARRGSIAGLLGWLACVGLLALASAGALADEADRGLERTVKAVFLYKFLNYAEWPESAFTDPRAPFVIGVYGADDIVSELTSLAAARPDTDRPVEVRKITRGDSLAGLHVLFVGSGAGNPLPMLAQARERRALLVVTESDRAAGAGTAINLLVVDGRVRFDVFLDAAEKAGIRLSSRLLAVARFVRNGSES